MGGISAFQETAGVKKLGCFYQMNTLLGESPKAYRTGRARDPPIKSYWHTGDGKERRGPASLGYKPVFCGGQADMEEKGSEKFPFLAEARMGLGFTLVLPNGALTPLSAKSGSLLPEKMSLLC